jgi:hypothetical protein
MWAGTNKAHSLRRSHWRFVTSNGAGLAAGIFAAEGGSITLADPKTGNDVKLRYGALGLGGGVGFKLPKLGSLHIPGAAASSESMPSSGLVCMAPSFRGDELRADDFNGACCFLEVSGGTAWGYAGCVMMFGMNAASLIAGAMYPLALQHGLNTSNGCLLFRGWNYGLQAGFSAGSFIGIIHT